jgi:hypothetical protein
MFFVDSVVEGHDGAPSSEGLDRAEELREIWDQGDSALARKPSQDVENPHYTQISPRGKMSVGAVHRNSSSRLRMSSPPCLPPGLQCSQSGVWILRKVSKLQIQRLKFTTHLHLGH